MKRLVKNLLLTLAASLGILTAGLVLPGCFENGNVGGSSYSAPTTTGCLTNGTPAGGYIRTNSIDAGHPGCNGPVGSFLVGVYTQYTGFPVPSTLGVCATEDLSVMEADGWIPLGLPERNALGCDSATTRFTSDPNYKNVVWMKRTSSPGN